MFRRPFKRPYSFCNSGKTACCANTYDLDCACDSICWRDKHCPIIKILELQRPYRYSDVWKYQFERNNRTYIRSNGQYYYALDLKRLNLSKGRAHSPPSLLKLAYCCVDRLRIPGLPAHAEEQINFQLNQADTGLVNHYKPVVTRCFKTRSHVEKMFSDR